MYRLGIILRYAVNASTFVGALALLMMIAHVVVEVFARNLFLYSIPGTSAIVANYYMAVVSFLPLGLAERMSQHISVEVAFQRMPERVQTWVLRLVHLLVCGVVTTAAVGFLQNANKKMGFDTYVQEAGIRVPDWPGYYMLPLGFGLFGCISAYRLLASFELFENGLDPVDPQPGDLSNQEDGQP